MVTQHALGIRRLEEDEQKEKDAVEAASVGVDAATVKTKLVPIAEKRKRRARKMTIRLATAANRSI